jgi:hypothetical protein
VRDFSEGEKNQKYSYMHVTSFSHAAHVLEEERVRLHHQAKSSLFKVNALAFCHVMWMFEIITAQTSSLI